MMLVPVCEHWDSMKAKVKQYLCCMSKLIIINVLSVTETHTTLLTVVELAVALLAIDDIKTIGDACHHVADFKVKPLGVLGAVSVRIQYEVILVSTQEKRIDFQKLC